jgi:F-type H+-transporting ATPase subunit delta
MKNPTLARRYAKGLVGALHQESEYAAVYAELSAIGSLLEASRELPKVLESPFVPKKKKDQIIRNILAASPPSEKTARFLDLLLAHNRLDVLAEILRAVPLLWKERQGVQTFEVNSAVSLTDQQRERLRAQLERLEGNPVFLDYRIDPGLVGGLSLRKGNVIYDASIQGRLAKLKQKMIEG